MRGPECCATISGRPQRLRSGPPCHQGLFVLFPANSGSLCRIDKVQDPDRNIPPLGKQGTPPKDIAPRHLTVGPFGPTDGRGAGQLYLGLETMRDERVPELFGKIPVSEPGLEGMCGVEGWCYTAATPSDRTAVLLLYGVDRGDATIAVVADVAFIRQPSLCARTPRVHAGLATLSGIRLGMSRAQVRASLGRPMAADSCATALKA